MCGIVGEFSIGGGGTDLERTKRRNASIVHRGPDESGEYWDPQRRCALAMRRLSIVDLGDGQQPMHNEDRSVWVVFNGEIYNHADLRKELENHKVQVKRALKLADKQVLKAGGRVYLAENTGMSKETLRKYYPRQDEFKKFIDPEFSTDFSRRLLGL